MTTRSWKLGILDEKEEKCDSDFKFEVELEPRWRAAALCPRTDQAAGTHLLVPSCAGSGRSCEVKVPHASVRERVVVRKLSQNEGAMGELSEGRIWSKMEVEGSTRTLRDVRYD